MDTVTNIKLPTELVLKEYLFSQLQALKSGVFKGKNEYLALSKSSCSVCL